VSRLREASVAFARTGAYPLLSVERMFAVERVAAALEARRLGGVEPWPELIERATATGCAGLSASAVRRLLSGIWADRAQAQLASAIVGEAVAIERRSTDRTLIACYLRDYPVDHIAFAPLRDAAAIAAERHAWSWRDAGRRWRLWEGPALLGEALRKAGDPQRLLHEAGFTGRLADGAFVSAARADAARATR
jgi:hypothetical protein